MTLVRRTTTLKNDAMPSFQTSPGSAGSKAAYLSGGSEETARPLLKYDISIAAFHLF